MSCCFLSPGLFAVTGSDSLTDVSGFRNVERVGTLVIANMGNRLPDFDGFTSLYSVSILIITRNLVRKISFICQMSSV